MREFQIPWLITHRPPTEQSDCFTLLLKVRESTMPVKKDADNGGSAGHPHQANVGNRTATGGFRPLTEQERQQFANSLDATGRRILAELAGEATDPIGSIENKVPFSAPGYRLSWVSVTWSLK
jgi:hypothetical protein